jgi:transcriptional regulator with XRE-family HTH domain
MNNSIGHRIKELRKHLNLTQIDFSEKIGIKQANLSHIENKSEKISIEIINSIISYFNIDANWLFTGKGEMLRTGLVSEAKDWPLSESPYKELYEKERQENRELYKKIGALESELEKYRRGEVEDVSTSNIVAISPIKQSA